MESWSYEAGSLATLILDAANSAVLFAEAPRTKWASVKDAMSWI